MKKIILISISILLMFSCKKESTFQSPKAGYFNNVITSLKDSLSDIDFSNISTQKAFITKINSRSYVRIPFKGKDISKDFVLLQTDNSGKIVRGYIIKLSRSTIEKGKEYQFNGFITKSSLNRKLTNTSTLTNGIITHARNARLAYRDDGSPDFSFPVPKDTIIIVTTGDGPSTGGVPPVDDGGTSDTDWLSVFGIFGINGSYGTFGAGGEYLYGGGGIYSMAGNTPNSGGTYPEWSQPEVEPDGTQVIITYVDALLVDFEPSEDLSPIDVTKFVKCFANIPDEGATCSIEILTDIPVDKDPNKLFNWQTRSVGHTFLQIKKTNGNLSQMQNIGFYPESDWKTLLTTAPVPGKFVDNGQHEFNASLSMNLTPEEFTKTLNEIAYLSSSVKYDIDEFNCTDFALDVFNTTRISNPLEIPKYDIPGGTAPNGTNTPQGLYNELKVMQAQGMESNNINIPGYKGYVAASDGPCN